MDYHDSNRSRPLLDISFITNLEINVLPAIISIVACMRTFNQGIFLPIAVSRDSGSFREVYCTLSHRTGNLVWITIVSLTNELISLDMEYTQFRQDELDCTFRRIADNAPEPHLQGIVLLWNKGGGRSQLMLVNLYNTQ